MKISKLQIEQFRHLENLDFDFTYPDDFHIIEKRGKPLDKICFIGQSATGKTSLLELIYDYSKSAVNAELLNGKSLSPFKNSIKKSEVHIQFNIEDLILTHKKDEIDFNNINYKLQNSSGSVSVTSLLSIKDKKEILYIKSDIISESNLLLFSKNPIEIIEKNNAEFQQLKHVFQNKEEYGIEISGQTDPELWLFLLIEILNYRKNFTQKMSELIHKGLLGNQEKLTSDFKKWQKENPNKLEEFAVKFNPILEKLNLEVDIVDTQYSIPIKNKRIDEVIPIQNTSTGTKGLLLSFLPLFKLDTKDAIILIDEPERSLYPDMQMDLMEHYQKLAPDAQFIVATHSPFIAASFEPEERFILYFDKEAKVKVRNGKSPIGDDPNDMLENDFGINYINKFGQKKHKEYLDLKQQMFFEKQENKKIKIAEKLEKLGEEYNF